MTTTKPSLLVPLALALWASLAHAAPAPAAPQEGGAQAESAEALIARGRELLEQERDAEAAGLFARAAELEPGPRTRFWQVRGWIAEGKVQEALLATDDLEATQAEKEYLRGLGFLAKAKQAVASGTAGQYTQGEFQDASTLLGRATDAEPERFPDAWLPLAEAAWMSLELDKAAAAIERAVARRPDHAGAHLVRGNIELSRFAAAHQGEEAAPELADDPHWKAAAESFRKVADLRAASEQADERRIAAEALVSLGNAWLWVDAQRAAEAYAEAIAVEPGAVDFSRAFGLLGVEGFGEALDAGTEGFAARHPGRHPAKALLTWWKGYADFARQRWADAEQAFRAAVGLDPGYVNSWYYVYRAAYAQQAYERAVDALVRGFQADPLSLASAMQADEELNLKIVEYLTGWCADPERTRYEAATTLSELATRVAPQDSRFWNNLGLFLRDHAEALYRADKQANAERAMEMWERSLEAYQHALSLEPDRPGYLNDTAVMLHYYLQRDLERAKELYQQAAKLAEDQIAQADLPPDELEWTRVALRDAKTNLRKVQRRMDALAAGTAQPKEPGDQDGD